MSKAKFFAASLIASFAIAASASAQGSATILGTSVFDQCAAAANDTAHGIKPGSDAVLTCNHAVAGARTTVGELAASYLNRGVVRMARGEHEQAIADFDQALKAQPSLAIAYNDRGIAQAALHHYSLATADFSKALDLQPAHPEQVLFNRAMAFEDQGDLKKAYSDYRKAAELAPTWEQPRKELARFNVSRSPAS